MSCARHRAAILEGALGSAVPDAAAAHLAACPECRQALERERELLLRIDTELQGALAVDPSPALVPRIREAVARGRSRRAWAWRLLLPALAGALVLLALAQLTPPAPAPLRDAAGARPEEAVAAPVAGVAALVPSPPTAAPEARPAARRPARTVVPAARTEPEVLVPGDQQAALGRLAALLRRGDRDLASLAAADAAPLQIEELKVAPLEIAPLSPDSPK